MHDIFKTTVLLLSMCSLITLAIETIYIGFFADKVIKSYNTVMYFTADWTVEEGHKYQVEDKEATSLLSLLQSADLFLTNSENYATQSDRH